MRKKSQIINNDLYLPAKQIPSPNCNTRPTDEISLLVIHNISLPPGKFGGGYVEKFFCNTLPIAEDTFFSCIADTQVSAHLFIDRLGVVTQFVPFSQRAWHAGRSEFNGRSECNDFSIGIELEGTDELPYTQAQYTALAEVTLQLIQSYPLLTHDRIVGHSDIAPMRKTDPGQAFDWVYFKSLLADKC